MRSTAGMPARRKGVWSSVIAGPVPAGKKVALPARRDAERTWRHSDGVEVASRGSWRSALAT